MVSRLPDSVRVNRAAFHDESRIKDGQPKMFCDPGWHDLVQVKGRVFAAPCIVIPIDDGESRFLITFDENRSVITAPRFIGWDVEKFDVTDVDILQEITDLLFVIMIGHVDSHWFGLPERVNHLGENRHHVVVGVRKTDSFTTRPGEPGRFVRVPTRRASDTLALRESFWRTS